MNQPINDKNLKAIASIKKQLKYNVLLLCICIAFIPFFYTKGHIIIDKMSSKSIDQYKTELEKQLAEINNIDAVTKNEKRLKEISKQNTSMIFNFIKKLPREFNLVASILLAVSALGIFNNLYSQYRFLKIIKNIQNAQSSTKEKREGPEPPPL